MCVHVCACVCAREQDVAGIDVLLVGDSVGMVSCDPTPPSASVPLPSIA